MNSIFQFQDAILSAIQENIDKKYFFLFDKWNTIEFHNGRKFKIKIIEEKEEEECK